MARLRQRRQWGRGSVQRGANGMWKIRWCEAGRRLTRGGFATRDDAERVLAKKLGDLAQGRTGLAHDSRKAPKLGELAPEFLKRRKSTHRAGAEDGYRWRKHLAPFFEHLRPAEVDAARIRAFIEAKRAEGVNPATIRIFVAILSALLTDLVERRLAHSNPCRSLPRSTMRLMRPTHDPRTTPFVEKLEDVRRIFLELPEPLNVAYAIGALAGLRTGEAFALKWEHVDLTARRMHVRESVSGPLKDKDSRVVPILDALLPILKTWRSKTGGEGLIIPPMRRDGDNIKTAGGGSTTGKYLRSTLKKLSLARPGLGWYEATRHTFASQWVLAGGSIEKLKEILGHYSVVVTERYAHLRPDLFPASDLATIALNLVPSPAEVRQHGSKTGSSALIRPPKQAERKGKSRSGPVSRVLFPLRKRSKWRTFI